MSRILLIEDHERLARLLCKGLVGAGIALDVVTRQVQQLLLLAEASEPHNYQFGTVQVQEMAGEAVAYLQRMAEAADVRLVVSAEADGVA